MLCANDSPRLAEEASRFCWLKPVELSKLSLVKEPSRLCCIKPVESGGEEIVLSSLLFKIKMVRMKKVLLHRKGRGKKVLKKEEKVIHPSLGRKNPMSLLLPIISILLLSLLVLLVRVGTTTYPDPEG